MGIREKLVEQLRELSDVDPPICQYQVPEEIELFGKADYIANGVTVGNSHRAGCIDDYGITGKKGPICGCPECGGYSSIVWDPVTDTNTCACGWTDSTTNVTVQEWHPASEPPEEDGRYFVARYDYVTKTPFTDILWFERGQWWNRLHGGNFAVTHWMPLPTPPKKEE